MNNQYNHILKKIKISIYVLLIIIITNSCTRPAEQQTVAHEEVSATTPEILVDNSDYKNFLPKRRDSDIISNLYKEALSKNTELNQLNEEIKNIASTKRENLSAYQKYAQINQDYWNKTQLYANRISDSTLRKSTLEIFETLESKYISSISEHNRTLKNINKRTAVLQDQLIVMQLLITEPMMKNYQLNEKPDIESMKTIITEYDRLIKESKEFTKTIK